MFCVTCPLTYVVMSRVCCSELSWCIDKNVPIRFRSIQFLRYLILLSFVLLRKWSVDSRRHRDSGSEPEFCESLNQGGPQRSFKFLPLRSSAISCLGGKWAVSISFSFKSRSLQCLRWLLPSRGNSMCRVVQFVQYRGTVHFSWTCFLYPLTQKDKMVVPRCWTLSLFK